MPNEPLTYWGYVRAAFTRPARVPLLGRMPVNQMALFAVGLLGLVNPGFWLLGAAVEVGYLALLSGSPRFQKLVQGERLLERGQDVSLKVQQAAAALSPELRERYRRLLNECQLILGIAPTVDARDLGTLADMRAGGLNQLLSLFLRLLTFRHVISVNLTQVDRRALEADEARLRERLAKTEPQSALGRSLQATLEIQSKRLENLERARSSVEVIDAELERVERQVRLIREETAVSGGPEMLSARLDAVSQTLAETSRWIDQNAMLLGNLASDELDAGPSSLPRLPEPDEEKTPSSPPPPPDRGAKQKG